MSLGIFVVGPSDKLVIPVLLRKLGQTAIHVRVVDQGDMLNVADMERHVRALKDSQRRLTKILIFIDSEGADPAETRRWIERPLDALRQRVRRPSVDYIVVDHSLEGWLACDEGALRAVLGQSARIRVQGNPEDHPRPAQLLGRVFRENGRDFRKTTHNLQLAEHANVDTIRARSPTFAYLMDVVKVP